MSDCGEAGEFHAGWCSTHEQFRWRCWVSPAEFARMSGAEALAADTAEAVEPDDGPEPTLEQRIIMIGAERQQRILRMDEDLMELRRLEEQERQLLAPLTHTPPGESKLRDPNHPFTLRWTPADG